jgi:alpha-beta hydrolase superfamily lysophospholipase
MRFILFYLTVLLLIEWPTTRLYASEDACSEVKHTRQYEEANCTGYTHTRAYDNAKVYGTNPTRGIVLYLHDCRGLDADKGWRSEWLDYLNLSGFIVIAIDSFADKRPPPAACSSDPWQNLEAKSMLYTVRIRQAENAVQKIREKYPGQMIFVWGHSEGGVTAQMMNAKIDGVISTGAPCPDWPLEGIAQTPFLVIQGTNDTILQETKGNPLYGSLDDRCKMLMTQPKWEWLTVDGMGHAAELSRMEVKKRITKFLGISHGR